MYKGSNNKNLWNHSTCIVKNCSVCLFRAALYKLIFCFHRDELFHCCDFEDLLNYAKFKAFHFTIWRSILKLTIVNQANPIFKLLWNFPIKYPQVKEKDLSFSVFANLWPMLQNFLRPQVTAFHNKLERLSLASLSSPV